MAPTWPAWGPRIMESDVDYDIADFIDDECGFKLFQHWVTDEGGLGVTGSRNMLNTGLFDRLFDKYKACGPYYKKYGGRYFTVVLVHLAMEVGATISKDHMAYANSVYKSAGLFQEGIDQFEEALRKYKNGKPYDFKSQGLYDTMMLSMVRPPGFDGNHHGERYFEEGVGTSELARTIMDRNIPLSCDYCGAPESKDPEAKTLLRCGKCKTEKYCDKLCQKNDWKIHKKHCYTPAQMAERAKAGKAPGSHYVGSPLSGFAMTAIIDPIENAHASR